MNIQQNKTIAMFIIIILDYKKNTSLRFYASIINSCYVEKFVFDIFFVCYDRIVLTRVKKSRVDKFFFILFVKVC